MNTPISDKKTVKILTEICLAEGIDKVVISPGSRNAPLIVSFAALKQFECFSIIDERSAAFFALGMAQQTGKPVALVCTSGTAVLNYAPAIAEAYYQNIPLVVITADRPGEWIDQADGQTIRQEGIYSNYIKYQCTLPADIFTGEDEWHTRRIISEAFIHCRKGLPGPVHINVPLREPLYGRTVHEHKKVGYIEHVSSQCILSDDVIRQLVAHANSTERIMILVGMRQPDAALSAVLNELSKLERIVVLTETISNCVGDGFVKCIDRVVGSIREEEAPLFCPDLLITLDGPVLSKMVKKLIRQYPPREHWHVSVAGLVVDTYRQLTRVVEAEPVGFLQGLNQYLEVAKSRYRDTWQHRVEQTNKIHQDYLKALPWCDFKVFDVVLKHLNQPVVLQLGNSTPVRYAQLLDNPSSVMSYANRGTSGIDGCVSTAVGAARVQNVPVVLMVGDLSFFYDSNALWNKYLSTNLKIVLINNGGGGIFRYIPGPADTDQLEEFFATTHQMTAEMIARQFNVQYFQSSDEPSLVNILPEFFAFDGPAILEVLTPTKENAKVLKNYFVTLKK
jgi:2-succinyl-5-enolpyruvyl-6-hydroxy-3-cyclohexene-1-carboxylate synthase